MSLQTFARLCCWEGWPNDQMRNHVPPEEQALLEKLFAYPALGMPLEQPPKQCADLAKGFAAMQPDGSPERELCLALAQAYENYAAQPEPFKTLERRQRLYFPLFIAHGWVHPLHSYEVGLQLGCRPSFHNSLLDYAKAINDKNKNFDIVSEIQRVAGNENRYLSAAHCLYAITGNAALLDSQRSALDGHIATLDEYAAKCLSVSDEKQTPLPRLRALREWLNDTYRPFAAKNKNSSPAAAHAEVVRLFECNALCIASIQQSLPVEPGNDSSILAWEIILNEYGKYLARHYQEDMRLLQTEYADTPENHKKTDQHVYEWAKKIFTQWGGLINSRNAVFLSDYLDALAHLFALYKQNSEWDHGAVMATLAVCSRLDAAAADAQFAVETVVSCSQSMMFYLRVIVVILAIVILATCLLPLLLLAGCAIRICAGGAPATKKLESSDVPTSDWGPCRGIAQGSLPRLQAQCVKTIDSWLEPPKGSSVTATGLWRPVREFKQIDPHSTAALQSPAAVRG